MDFLKTTPPRAAIQTVEHDGVFAIEVFVDRTGGYSDHLATVKIGKKEALRLARTLLNFAVETDARKAIP